jgi:hypothetical protein
MQKGNSFIRIEKSKNFGLGEQGIMVLLLVVTAIQIACAVSASSCLVPGKPVAAVAAVQDGTLLAKK